MKNQISKTIITIVALAMIILITPKSEAQFLEDALRLDYGMLGSGGRALSMGTAYLPIANDFSATFYNPAGLAQIRKFEISGGLRHTSFNNDASYLGNITGYRASSTNLDNLGLVIPVPTVQGSLTFAIGYNRVNDFTQVTSFEAFNENDSIIPDLFLTRDEMSYYLYLSDEFGATPFTGYLQQYGTQEEFGSVNNWSFSGGIEVVPNFFLGTTLNLISGRYQHTFIFEEEDTRNEYDTFPDDFEYLYVEDNIDARLSGVNAIFGGLFNLNNIFSFGATIQTPTRYSIEEDYSTYGRSRFTSIDDEGFNTYEDDFSAFIDYDVSTPWKFGVGASFSLAGLTVAGAIDYQDWSQLEFRNAPSEIMSINRTIRESLEPTTNLRAGAEFKFPMIPLAVRGGFIHQPSPYVDAPSKLNRNYLTGGIGIEIQDAIYLDLAIIRGMWESELTIYDYDIWNESQGMWQAVTRIVDEDNTKNSIVFSFRYRF